MPNWLQKRWGNGPSWSGAMSTLRNIDLDPTDEGGFQIPQGQIPGAGTGSAMPQMGGGQSFTSIPSVGGMANRPGAMPPMPGEMNQPMGGMIPGPDDIQSDGMGESEGLGSKIGGAIQSVGKFAKDYGPAVLAGLSTVEGIRSQREAEKMRRRAVEEEEERKRSLEGERKRRDAIEAPDLSNIFADPDNPYARRRRIPAVGRGA